MTIPIDTIPLHGVVLHKDTQSRIAMNQATIDEYAEAIRLGADFPPVVTFFDGAVFWLADGFHRYFAHEAAGVMEIASEQRDGTHRDAILYSCGANAAHGLRRTNEDKRRAVQTLLNDPEWAAWTQSKIAEACGVSREFVSRLSTAQEPSCDRSQDAIRTVERNGKTYEQNTANIGKAKPADDAPGPESSTAPDTPVQVPFDEVQALREQLSEIADNMKSTLADNEMMGRVFDADDRIKASMDEATRQSAIAECSDRQYNAQQGKLVALTKQVTHWMSRAQKAEKELEKLRGDSINSDATMQRTPRTPPWEAQR